ncbi:MAG: Pr6Pr family membrane protein [Holdemanella sp.]|nr:Pr6Pr family membrane protein [Holdemanella sp.]
MKERTLKIVIEFICVSTVLYGLFMSVESLKSFTYFTTLSNVFIGCTMGYALLLNLCNKEYSQTFYRIKFLSVISITLTFLVFMFMLAPVIEGGMIKAYTMQHYGSFCLHFLAPILTVVDFFLFDYKFRHNKYDAYLSVVPPLVYVSIVFILGKCGMRWMNDMVMPYNFLNYKAPTGWFGFDLSIMSFETLGIGVVYSILFLLILFILLGHLFLKLKDMRKNGASIIK